jgi:MFS family permease
MRFHPSAKLSEREVKNGLKLVVYDGLAAEAMATLTGGTFLVAIALYLGATDVQIGLLAALPTLTNVFQLFAIWLVQRYNKRKAIATICNTIARLPLLLIGLLPFLFAAGTSLEVLIFLLCFHYFFGSVAGASWNSWMKDLIPEQVLGTYFSHRTRMIQILNVTLSLWIALMLDFVKEEYPQYEMTAYSLMFLTGGLAGLTGVYLLSRTPEPEGIQISGNLFLLFTKPFVNRNFRKLLAFNSFWAFSINLATPFFTVYMLQILKLPLSYIILFNILMQVSGILFVKVWGRYADRYSNKTIISVCAPTYIFCMLGWIFTATIPSHAYTLLVLVFINVFSGITLSGINLALNNIGIKLAPKEEAIVYISAKNMAVALIAAMAPLVAGALGDFFATHEFVWKFEWKTPEGSRDFSFVEIRHYRFLFIIGAALALISLQWLRQVKESGEVNRDIVINELKTNFKTNILDLVASPQVQLLLSPLLASARLRSRISYRMKRGMVRRRRRDRYR